MVERLTLELKNGEIFEAARRLPRAGMEKRVLQLQGTQEKGEPHQAGPSDAERWPP